MITLNILSFAMNKLRYRQDVFLAFDNVEYIVNEQLIYVSQDRISNGDDLPHEIFSHNLYPSFFFAVPGV